MVDLTQIIIAIITLIISLITVYVIPYIKTKVSSEQLDMIMFWVEVAVKAAEMTYKGSGKGAEKKEFVLEFLRSKGFTLNMVEIDSLIESAVHELKLTQKEEA